MILLHFLYQRSSKGHKVRVEDQLQHHSYLRSSKYAVRGNWSSDNSSRQFTGPALVVLVRARLNYPGPVLSVTSKKLNSCNSLGVSKKEKQREKNHTHTLDEAKQAPMSKAPTDRQTDRHQVDRAKLQQASSMILFFLAFLYPLIQSPLCKKNSKTEKMLHTRELQQDY